MAFASTATPSVVARNSPPQPGAFEGIQSVQDVHRGGGAVTAIDNKRRRTSLKTPGLLKRAVSTPSIRSVASADNNSSSSDKKRNKLGYHRTAVACGHCRRRKIRCIPAFEDVAGRCQNCIRLKKDCHFFPVDQDGQIIGSRRVRSGSRVDAGDRDATSSSPSPVLTPAIPFNSPGPLHGAINTSSLSQRTFQEDYGHQVGPGDNAAYDRGQAHALQSHAGHLQTHGASLEEGTNADHFFRDRPFSQTRDQQARFGQLQNPSYGSFTRSPQSDTFQFPQPSPGIQSPGWLSQTGRSMSIPGPDDFAAYGVYHRAQTFPSIGRRMSDFQNSAQLQQPGHHLSRSGHHSSNPTGWHGHDLYHQSGLPGSDIPSSVSSYQPLASTAAYDQPWYTHPTQVLGHVQEEEQGAYYQDHSPNYQGSHYNPG